MEMTTVYSICSEIQSTQIY